MLVLIEEFETDSISVTFFFSFSPRVTFPLAIMPVLKALYFFSRLEVSQSLQGVPSAT